MKKSAHGARSSGKAEAEMGTRIRVRRMEKGISQSDLGKQLGVSFQQVQKYERGSNRVSAPRLEQIAKALDVPIIYFYEGVNGNTKGDREVETLLALDTNFSLRLLRAYSAIKSQTVQRKLVSLMESFAAAD